jgi:hypothetical protein
MRRLFQSVIVVAAAVCSGAALASPDLNQWVQQLAAQGYSVGQGSASMTSCQAFIAVFGRCAGNNPNSPYIFLEPPVGSEYVDPYYAAPFNANVNGTDVNSFYRLANTDALVTVVKLPPTAAYLGYQSYVFTRELAQYPWKWFVASNRSPDPERVNIIGSVGNDINNAVIAAQLGSVWDAGQVVYITTANQALAQALEASAAAAGNASRVFVEPLGSSVNPGLDSGADDLETVIRYAVPEDSSSGSTWFSNLSDNVQVYRVSASNSRVTRYGASTYTAKRIAPELLNYSTAVSELASLMKTWLASAQGSATIKFLTPSIYVNFFGQIEGLVGSECLAYGLDCAGDDQDTDSYRAAEIGELASNQAAFIVGVDHTALHDASYINLSFYDTNTSSAFASVVQTNAATVGFTQGTLNGSAAAALQYLGLYQHASSALTGKLPELYVVMISRQCPAGQSWCLQVDPTQISDTTPISVIHRAYLKPGTTTGANPDLMVTPELIH